MEKYFFAALKYVKNCGNAQMKVLLHHFEKAENIWQASEKALLDSKFISEEGIQSLLELRKNNVVERMAEACEKNNIGVLSYLDDSYPESLRAIVSAPASIFVKGSSMPSCANRLGVVGPRMASKYGKEVAEYLVSGLEGYDFCIVSGGARGIDTIAHRTALQHNMPTVAVLGCGLDIVYPAENKQLFEEIMENGMLVSEYPPGTAPAPKNFPSRNRIISGMCQGVLLAEAAQRSGALITAEFAMDQGREVYCVPGNIFSAQSVGVNNLLKQGAKVVTSPLDILEDYYSDVVPKPEVEDSAEKKIFVEYEQTSLPDLDLRVDSLTDTQKVVWSVLQERCGMSLEDIMLACDMDVGILNLTVLELEILGYIKSDVNNRKYIKVKGVR